MSTATATRAEPSIEEQGAEIDRWLLDPLYWAKRFGGEDFDPWSGQEDLWREYGKILNAKLKRLQCGPEALTETEQTYADKMGISVMAGHGMGKERTLGLMMLHYLFVLKRYQPKGICTAPAGPTLQSTLWPEFGKVIAGSEVLTSLFEKQSDRIFLKEDVKRGEFMRIEPRTIQQNSNPEEQGVVLAGIHAIGVFYGITEASGVPEPVFKPIEGGLTDPLSLIVMIFNPTNRTGFAALSHTTNRKHWVCLQWDGRTLKREKLANPGRYRWYNERAQDALIEKYGADSDTVRIRVYGLPPKQSADTLIHYESAMDATKRVVTTAENDPLCVYVDVGGEGEDPSVVTVLRGPVVLAQTEHRTQGNMAALADIVAGIFADQVSSLSSEVQYAIGVDTIGMGRGVYDNLLGIHLLRNVYKLNVSELPMDQSQFHRLRDQVWWELRDGFMTAPEIDLSPMIGTAALDTLVSEITSIKWAEVNGRIKVQGKGGSSGIPNVRPLTKSPNYGDSLVGAWYLYKHATSRLPASHRRRRRVRRRVSHKVI